MAPNNVKMRVTPTFYRNPKKGKNHFLTFRFSIKKIPAHFYGKTIS